MGDEWISHLYCHTYCNCCSLLPVDLRVGLVPFRSFLFFYISTGMSITVGYHRLFSHKAFQAKWPVKLYVLLFGAAAFENSAIWWSSEHRKHHKHVDTDEDPYDITKGFFWAHMGWLMFKLKPEPPSIMSMTCITTNLSPGSTNGFISFLLLLVSSCPLSLGTTMLCILGTCCRPLEP